MKLPLYKTPKVTIASTAKAKKQVVVVPVSNNKSLITQYSKYLKQVSDDTFEGVKKYILNEKVTLLFVSIPKKEELKDTDIKKFGYTVSNSLSNSADVVVEEWGELVKFFTKAVLTSENHFRGDIICKDEESRIAELFLYGIYFGAYSFDHYVSNKKSKVNSVTIIKKSKASKELNKTIKDMNNYATSLWFERDLVNISPSTTTPKWVAAQMKTLLTSAGFSVQILSKQQLIQKKYLGLLAVGCGSDQDPVYLVAKYTTPKAKKHVVLVGKGITFDTGGVNLKPDGGKNMKGDMCGSATVVAAGAMLANNGCNVNIAMFVPLAENHLGGSAYRPDDVIVYRNGLSVEVENTDAEGRMVLAEGLIDGSKLKPDLMIDMATLTGACAIAVGREGIGFVTNNKNLSKIVLDASTTSTETHVEFPLVDNYNNLLKSHVADVKHIGGRYGGMINAALFLQKFVGEKSKGNPIDWIHFDLSSAYSESPTGIFKAGATGMGIMSVVNVINKFCS